MGTPLIWAPVTVAAGVNDKLDFYYGSTYAGTIAPGTYYSPWELGKAIADAMNNAINVGFWCAPTNRVLPLRTEVMTDQSSVGWLRYNLSSVSASYNLPAAGETTYVLAVDGNTGIHGVTGLPVNPNDRLYMSAVASAHTSAYNPAWVAFSVDGNATCAFNLTAGTVTVTGSTMAARISKMGVAYLCEAWEVSEDPMWRRQEVRGTRWPQIWVLNASGALSYLGTSGNAIRLWNTRILRFGAGATAQGLGHISPKTLANGNALAEYAWEGATIPSPRFQLGSYTGTTFNLYFGSGSNRLTSIHRDIGFLDVDGGPLSLFTAQIAPWNLWSPNRRPIEDDGPQFESVGTLAQANAGPAQYLEEGVVETRELQFQLPWEKATRWGEQHPMRGFDPLQTNWDQLTPSLERIWKSNKSRFRYYPDSDYPAEFHDYCFDEKTSKGLVIDRPYKGKNLIRVKLKMRRVA